MKNVNFGFYCGKSIRKRENTSPRKHCGFCFSMMYREIMEIDSPGINGAFCLLEGRGKQKIMGNGTPAHLQQSSSDYMSFPKKSVEFLVSVAFFKFNKEESQYNL